MGVINFLPIQNLNGYDSPWPPGGGKNLYNPETDTPNTYIRANEPVGEILSTTSNYSLTDYIAVLPNTTYTINYNGSSTASAAGMVFFSEKNETAIVGSISLSNQTYPNGGYSGPVDSYTFTTANNCYYIRFSTFPAANNIQLELGDTATSYVPYSNICSIVAPVHIVGKNLFDESSVIFNEWTDGSGVISTISRAVRSTNIPVFSNTDYSIGFYGDAPYSYSIIELDVHGTFISRAHKSISGTATVSPGILTVTTSPSTAFVYIQTYTYRNAADVMTAELLASYKIMFGLSSTGSSTYEPYTETPIYGGYLDVGNSELVEEWVTIQRESGLTETAYWIQYKESNGYIAYRTQVPGLDTNSTSLSNMISSFASFNSADMTKNIIQRQTSAASSICYIALDANLDVGDVQYTFKLATPIHHPLNAAQLAFIMDELGIRKSSMLESRRRIMLNSPHLATTTAPIASFNTDMKADVKSLKVHFAPVQEGTGDPSPTNVRPITGWSGANTWRTGRNICHIVGYSASTLNIGGYRSSVGSYGTSLSTTSPERSVTITQTEWPNESNVSSYTNGYFVIAEDNLKFGENYNVSFTVDVTNNPLNVSLSSLKVGAPGGSGNSPRSVNVNRVEYRIPYRQHSTYTKRRGLEVYNCGMSMTISDIVVTHADETDLSYEAYNGNNYPVDWTNDAGTVYGGYLDLINGELVATYKMADLAEDFTWAPYSNNTRLRSYTVTDMAIPKTKNTPANLVGEKVYPIAQVSNLTTYTDGIIVMDTAYWLVYFNGTDYPSGKIAYELSTPIHYSLTPETIKTLNDSNNIFADTNGDIEVTYWTH